MYTNPRLTPPLDIAVIMASAGSRLGGLETAAREFAAGLAVRGHHVKLVTGAGPGAPLQPDISSYTTPYEVVTAPMLGQNSLPARLVARYRGVHPSIVEARSFWEGLRHSKKSLGVLRASGVISAHFEVEAVEASLRLSIPTVYYYAGPVDPRRLARARLRRLVSISHMVADYHASIADRFGLRPVDSVVLPGVRARIVAGSPAPGVYSDRPEAVYTGRIDAVPQKRVEKLVEWWPAVLRSVPSARLTLVGGGTGLDALRLQVRERGLAGSVSLPGPLPHEAIPRRLRKASLYLFPSMMETFGIAPLEALAVGLPVIASDIPALRESLGDAARLVPPDDERAWIETIIHYLSSPEARLDLAARGPIRARELTWEKQSAAYETQLLAATSTSPSALTETSSRRSAPNV